MMELHIWDQEVKNKGMCSITVMTEIIHHINSKNNNLKLVELSNNFRNAVYLLRASSKRTHPFI